MSADTHASKSYAEQGVEIEAIDKRLYRRRADMRAHAGIVGQQVRAKLSSPVALIGAVGLGFAVAWFFPKRREPEPADSPNDAGAATTSSILNLLNLAGMALSLFPSLGGAVRSSEGAASGEDPR